MFSQKPEASECVGRGGKLMRRLLINKHHPTQLICIGGQYHDAVTEDGPRTAATGSLAVVSGLTGSGGGYVVSPL